MAKIALITNVGNSDNFTIPERQMYKLTGNVTINKYNDHRDISIHAFLNELKKLKLEPTERTMDLLVIACSMYAADTRINRNRYADDAWTRMIDLFIPVSDVEFWMAQRVVLETIFRFLSGDIWSIHFRSRTNMDLLLSPKGNRRTYGMPYSTDTVCLFSGGMDSLIGAIDLLASGVTPLLVGHHKSSDVSPYQNNCLIKIKQVYEKTPPHLISAFIRIQDKKLFGIEDHTERGRSFLFLTLGAVAGSALGTFTKLIIPENGMISLNIPLTPLRIGSHSTRTTHPYYFILMQSLFDEMQIGVKIVNPYQFKTKGEMLANCANNTIVKNAQSMSCSHPSGRWQGEGNGHCGYCVPCIIRQASFRAADIDERYKYRTNIFKPEGVQIDSAEGRDILAFKFMIEKVNKNPGFLTAAIRSTGPLGSNVDDFIAIYRRALTEVEELLTPVRLI